MSEREKILGRIREALKVNAPLPGSHGDTVGSCARRTARQPRARMAAVRRRERGGTI